MTKLEKDNELIEIKPFEGTRYKATSSRYPKWGIIDDNEKRLIKRFLDLEYKIITLSQEKLND